MCIRDSYYMVTDAGQLARSMHGARRKDGYFLYNPYMILR